MQTHTPSILNQPERRQNAPRPRQRNVVKIFVVNEKEKKVHRGSERAREMEGRRAAANNKPTGNKRAIERRNRIEHICLKINTDVRARDRDNENERKSNCDLFRTI